MKLYTYRYLFKTNETEEGKIGVKIVTDTLEGLQALEKVIVSDENILSCLKEYVNEVDLSFVGCTETVKKEIKKDGE